MYIDFGCRIKENAQTNSASAFEYFMDIYSMLYIYHGLATEKWPKQRSLYKTRTFAANDMGNTTTFEGNDIAAKTLGYASMHGH